MNQNEKASEEQITEYTLQGLKLLHGPKTRDSVIEMLSVQDKTEGLATATVHIISVLDTEAQIDDVGRVVAANIIMGELIKVGVEAGVMDDPPEEERAEAFKRAVAMYTSMGVRSGKYTQEEVQAAVKQGGGQGVGAPGQAVPPAQGAAQGNAQRGILG